MVKSVLLLMASLLNALKLQEIYVSDHCVLGTCASNRGRTVTARLFLAAQQEAAFLQLKDKGFWKILQKDVLKGIY